eukprot:1860656-Ditylum_brightwellii.AAC.1
MNEKACYKVLQWEDMLSSYEQNKGGYFAGGIKLLRFQCQPSDLSPKAYFKHNILGHLLPFD